LHWKAPASDGGDAITQYEVFCSTDDPLSPGNTASATVTTTAANLSHLISGTPWHCVVVADNTVGSSVQSLVVTATPT
jgi:hypothetical protein